ncbi:MAG TPA: L-threonylcarbamoyladenylate synthase [Chloroflexota bacterium]|nr:L-threonylcarbamoyladenylate synthase [Chloroflexota bacterium]
MSADVLPAYAAVALDRAAEALRNGELVIVPTDTVYGVAAALSRPDAVEKIYQAKGRRPDKPIALLVDRLEDVEQVAVQIPECARILMKEFWPGGLTIVLQSKPNVPAAVTAGGPTVAVRMPNHPVPRGLIRRLGEPLPTTSANRSNQPSPVNVAEALHDLGFAVAIALDAGPAPGGVESTVIDVTVTPPVVYRVGAISVDQIERALGRPVERPRV